MTGIFISLVVRIPKDSPEDRRGKTRARERPRESRSHRHYEQAPIVMWSSPAELDTGERDWHSSCSIADPGHPGYAGKSKKRGLLPVEIETISSYVLEQVCPNVGKVFLAAREHRSNVGIGALHF